MRPQDFRFRLEAASFRATEFASTMVRDRLPYCFRYCVALNASHDEGREPDEVVYPADNKVVHPDLGEDEVVALLCREFRVPQWIDISVGYATRTHTHLSLICCGRYHSKDRRLYYFERGTQPFGIKSPSPPRDHTEGRKFRLPNHQEFHAKMRRHHAPSSSAPSPSPADASSPTLDRILTLFRRRPPK